MQLFFIYLAIINVIAILAAISDKKRAKQNRRRISERTLIFLCILGGSPGMYLTMRKIHHKTLHRKFMVGIPCIFVIQILATVVVWYQFL